MISRRYENKSTLVTTNHAFKVWHEVFPNAACVVSLIARSPLQAQLANIDLPSDFSPE